MPLRARPEARVLALVALAVACALTLRGSFRHSALPVETEPAASTTVLEGGHPAVSLGDLMIVVLRTPSVAQRLLPGALPTEGQERSWSAEDYAAQQQLLTDLASHGIAVRPDYSFARVLDGFSAQLPPKAVALLDSNPEVSGVYPVRAAYPTSVAGEAAGLGGALADDAPAPAGLEGAGVSIALLDAGLERDVPYLSGHLLPSIDVLGAATAAARAPQPVVAHATQLAGILVGSGGPDGLRGVAPGASVLPIQVAGWQADGHGGRALYARSDELIAGLERAVDPSGDGDVLGAVRVALLGVAEPYAAFSDSPEAQAVAGARALGVLVVAPAGNDGAAGPSFGSVAGPAGSPAALSVGAVDARAESSSMQLVVRRGLEVVADEWVPLLAGPGGGLPAELRLARRAPVRGAAVVVAASGDPAAAVERMVSAGAAAVLLAGAPPPSGSLATSTVPVVWIPETLARALGAANATAPPPTLALGAQRATPNVQFGSLAAFSSRGLAFDGLVDPELAAPGVELLSSDPGRAASFSALSGTSVAAATVAGAAAVLAAARPALDASEIASLLVGGARPGGFRPAAGGVGTLDLGASLSEEVAASSTSLGFVVGQASGSGSRETIELLNVSTRPLSLRVVTGSRLLRAEPARLTLPLGASATVELLASQPVRVVAGPLTGTLAVVPSGGPALRIPWAIEPAQAAEAPLRLVELSPAAFASSAAKTALLRVQVGGLSGGAPGEVEPVARLELRLYRQDGRSFGVLATLRDLLPGIYRFAITGRDAAGSRLPPGRYRLVLVAWPTLRGAPTRLPVPFRIE